jgi:hypothetical protein
MSTGQNAPNEPAIRLIGESLAGNPHNHRRLVKDREIRAITNNEGRPSQLPLATMTTSNTTRTDNDSSTSEASSSSTFETRQCAGLCGQPIPNKRLIARPNARMCVPCQEAAGDIPVIRRFDETTADGNKLETFFSTDVDPRLTRYMHRLNTVTPADIYFDLALGDDSHLTREGDSIIDVARPLSSEFDDDQEPEYNVPLLMAA